MSVTTDRYPEFYKPCPHCGGAAHQLGHMLCVVCAGCGAATRGFTSTMGEFQREHEAARSAWNRGDVNRGGVAK